MATYTGKDGAVYVGEVAVAEIKDWSLEESASNTSDTVMGDVWETHKITQKSWTASFNAFWDADDSGQAALTVGSSIVLNLYPTGNTTGEVEWSGTCSILSISRSAAFDGLIEASFSVTGNGALVKGAV